jgi:hypothetical protein
MEANISSQVAKFPGFSWQQLRDRWQKLYGRAAPPGMQRNQKLAKATEPACRSCQRRGVRAGCDGVMSHLIPGGLWCIQWGGAVIMPRRPATCPSPASRGGLPLD